MYYSSFCVALGQVMIFLVVIVTGSYSYLPAMIAFAVLALVVAVLLDKEIEGRRRLRVALHWVGHDARMAALVKLAKKANDAFKREEDSNRNFKLGLYMNEEILTRDEASAREAKDCFWNLYNACQALGDDLSNRKRIADFI